MHALNDSQLLALLEDDVPCADLTTDTVGIGEQSAQIEFRARFAMTVCASEEAARMFESAKADRAAGGIRSDNAGAYGAGGAAEADFLVTSAAYMAVPSDVQVNFGKSG
ncbi:MAG TPA: hypothetical protein PLB25_10235 [Rhodoferax sp.]|nr:hypothetical protein [Rhodoferax sp.]